MNVLCAGHIQFGEEEVQIGSGWDQSPRWSADKSGVDVYAAVRVTCVPGQYTRIPSQGFKGGKEIQFT